MWQLDDYYEWRNYYQPVEELVELVSSLLGLHKDKGTTGLNNK